MYLPRALLILAILAVAFCLACIVIGGVTKDPKSGGSEVYFDLNSGDTMEVVYLSFLPVSRTDKRLITYVNIPHSSVRDWVRVRSQTTIDPVSPQSIFLGVPAAFEKIQAGLVNKKVDHKEAVAVFVHALELTRGMKVDEVEGFANRVYFSHSASEPQIPHRSSE